jgi:hypothetical protein
LIEKGERGSVGSDSSLRTLLSGRQSGLFRYMFDDALFSSGPYRKAYAHTLKADKRQQATAQRRSTMLESVSEIPQANGESSEAGPVQQKDEELAKMLNYIEDPQAKSRTLNLIKLLMKDGIQDDTLVKTGDGLEKTSEKAEFADYYSLSQEKIVSGSVVAVLWSYQSRANDEFELERGDLIKVVGVWDDGWATGYKCDDRAEDWEARGKDSVPIFKESGVIKAFPVSS